MTALFTKYLQNVLVPTQRLKFHRKNTYTYIAIKLVECKGKLINFNKILVRKFEGKMSLECHRSRWDHNVKFGLERSIQEH